VITDEHIGQLETQVSRFETEIAARGPLAKLTDAKEVETTAIEWRLGTDELILAAKTVDALQRTRDRLSFIIESCDYERLKRLATLQQDLVANDIVVDKATLLAAEATAGIEIERGVVQATGPTGLVDHSVHRQSVAAATAEMCSAAR
jgi:hypothetical protein